MTPAELYNALHDLRQLEANVKDLGNRLEIAYRQSSKPNLDPDVTVEKLIALRRKAFNDERPIIEEAIAVIKDLQQKAK